MTTAPISNISRFRFCPKHKKPLPCVHCKMIEAKPALKSKPEPEAEFKAPSAGLDTLTDPDKQ